MSSKPCSLAFDMEEEAASNGINGTLTLLVNKRYVSMGSSQDVGTSSFDVIEFGGTITVSF
ncbi:MAG: hypothetical protein H0U49_03825 [Parachlamydiaceae bacterium]|nr:hypothetical protein [Parachlamydiaceae bacterium]